MILLTYNIAETSLNWDAISAIGTLFIGLITALVAIIPLYLYHWSHNIKVLSFAFSSSNFNGDGFDVVLFNKTLSPKTITEIEIVKDNKHILTIKKYESPLILEPMKSIKIIGDKYIEIPLDKNPNASKTYFIITIDGKERYVKWHGKVIKYKLLDRIKNLERMAEGKKCFGETFLSKRVKYVLHYKVGDVWKSTFILDSGLIEKTPFYFNLIPVESMKSDDTLIDFIKNKFPEFIFKIQNL